MTKSPRIESPDNSSFASRRAEREANEATEGPTPRRELPRADYSDDFTVGNVTVRRVQR